MVNKISGKEFAQVKDAPVAVVDFSATWCGPCRMLAPVLEQVSEELSEVSFYNVDVDEAPAVAAQFGIQNIPALVVLKNGAKADMQVGFAPKETITAFVRKNLG